MGFVVNLISKMFFAHYTNIFGDFQTKGLFDSPQRQILFADR